MILPQMTDVSHDRQKYVGGSDVPIIMGISAFKTRYELLLEKAELKEKDFVKNKYTDYGNDLEPKIREHIADQYGMEFIEYTAYNDTYRYNDDGVSDEYVLEIKTTSQIKENVRDYKHYIVQLLVGMKLHNKNGILAIYERPEDFDPEFDEQRLTLYHIDMIDYLDWLDEIDRVVTKFNLDLERVNTTYLLEDRVMEEAELVHYEIVELGNKIAVLEQEIAIIKEKEKLGKELKAQLKEFMEIENVKSWTLPNKTKITLVADKPDTTQEVVNHKKMIEDNPELARKYNETKIKKGSKGYVRITIPKNK